MNAPNAVIRPFPSVFRYDASFLLSDTTHSNSNVTLIHIYDQSTVPKGKLRFKDILTHIERRLAGLPMFRQKLRVVAGAR